MAFLEGPESDKINSFMKKYSLPADAEEELREILGQGQVCRNEKIYACI
jgi:hypothetical protein